MRHTAEVFLWGTRIGIVSQGDEDAEAAFEYDRAFLRSGIEVSPVAMPLSPRVYRFSSLNAESFHGLPGLLSDSLPDKFGNAVIDNWLARQGRPSESFTAIERLCYTGKRGMGALEYVPAEGPDAGISERIHVERLISLASDVLSDRSDIAASAEDADLQALLKFGTSAGGARAKAIVAWNRKTGDIRSGQIQAESGFSHWIMKFSGVSNNRDKEDVDGDDYTRIEYAYYLMALRAGLRMNECRLFEENGRKHFMAKRFDREEGTGRKIHMQTLAALAHWDYLQPGAYGYEQAADICRRIGLHQDSAEELFRRMVFNVCAMNQDDHVKNISFLMDRAGRWSLAPAYDVTFAFNPKGRWTGSHQMSVNGKRSEIRLADVLATARCMNISATRAKRICGQVQEAVDCWPEFAEQAGVGERRMALLQKTFPRLV